MRTTEQLIVEQLKQGNDEAYKYLYRHHYALLCHVANGYVGDDFLAETLVGDVIFHLWEIRETLEVQTSLRSYLMRAVRNRCLDYLSSKRKKSEVAFSVLGGDEEMKERYILSDDYPLGVLLERELEEEIHAAIRRLPEMCRKVFLMSRFGGKSYEEIAETLHMSVNTVKYHVKTALAARTLGNTCWGFCCFFIVFLEKKRFPPTLGKHFTVYTIETLDEWKKETHILTNWFPNCLPKGLERRSARSWTIG